MFLTIMQKYFLRQNVKFVFFFSKNEEENKSFQRLVKIHLHFPFLACSKQNNKDKKPKNRFSCSILIHAIYYAEVLNIIECFRSIFSFRRSKSNFLLLLRNIKAHILRATSIKDVWSTEYEELLLRLLLLMMMWLGEELIVVWGVK